MEPQVGFQPTTSCVRSRRSKQSELLRHKMEPQIGLEPMTSSLPRTRSDPPELLGRGRKADSRVRTDDLRFTKPLLYRLSYVSNEGTCIFLEIAQELYSPSLGLYKFCVIIFVSFVFCRLFQSGAGNRSRTGNLRIGNPMRYHCAIPAKWSGWPDFNGRPRGPRPRALSRLSYSRMKGWWQRPDSNRRPWRYERPPLAN